LAELKTLDVGNNVLDAITLMEERNMGSAVVTCENKVVGILTERDLLKKLSQTNGLKIESLLSETMTRDPIVITDQSTVAECIYLMVRREFRHIPIVNELGGPYKMISINDILKFIKECFPNDIERHGTIFKWTRNDTFAQEETFEWDKEVEGKVSGNIFLTPLLKLLVQKPLKLDENTSVQETILKINENNCGAVIITSFETKVVGIVTERDFLRKVYGKVDLSKEAIPISNFMTANPHCLLTEHLLAHAINNMSACTYRNIILVDEERFPLGLISLSDILLYLFSKVFPTQELTSFN
jgi:CBS domain-containing protein